MKKRIGLSLALAAVMGMVLISAFFSVALAETPVPASQSGPIRATEPPPATLTVLGQITNGTSGGSLPVTMTVTLYALEGRTLGFTMKGTADASGKVRFEKLAYKAGRAYALAAVQGSVEYHSDLVPPMDGEKSLILPFQIYDSTSDTSRVRVDEMYVVGQFLSDKELQVTNAFILTNDGDRTVEGGERAANGQTAALRFYMPPGASKLEFQGDDGKSFLATEDGFVATKGLVPGPKAAQIVARYTLPYTGQLHLETKAPYAVGKLSVLLADQGVSLTSASLVDQGTLAGQDGIIRRAYTGSGLAAGKAVTFNLNGSPKVTAPAAAQGSAAGSASPASPAPGLKQDSRRLLGEGVVAVGLLAILAASIWRIVSLRSRPVDEIGEHRALFEALADLDEDHDAGKISEQDYAEQREFLKAALLAALQNPAARTAAPADVNA